MSLVHDYTSTACTHEIHDRCRRSCKFCTALCACDCHGAHLVTVSDDEYLRIAEEEIRRWQGVLDRLKDK